MEPTKCPNCGAEIRDTVLRANPKSSQNEINAANELLKMNKEAYCSKCFPELKSQIHQLKKESNAFVNAKIHFVPVITTHSPFGWDYSPIGIVTGQSVTGTGVISEFTSGFSDFFGQQSGSFIRKIASGEEICLAQLRIKALNSGGQAVIATDIDYGELGSVKGMIMVCAAGTAVKLNNLDVLGSSKNIVAELSNKISILNSISKYNLIF